jgi:signal transduction histidine kinase
LLICLWATGSASAVAPKRILILDSFGRDVAPFNAAVSTFRTTIARELGQPVDIYEASLDRARFAAPEKDGPFVEFLRSRFEAQPLDLVVPIGAPAVKFAMQYREKLFPDTPIVYTGVDPRLVPPSQLRSNATLVTQKVNLPGIIEDILQLQPDTTNVAVVFGASPLEKFWLGECQREFQSFTNRLAFTWLDNLPLDQMKQRVASLPPHSFVMFGMLVIDAAGVPYDNDDALRQLHAVAKVPIFGYFESQLGGGAIGGRLYHDAQVGALAAGVAIRILHGARADSFPPVILETGNPVYDWRELRQWQIPEERLPAGSEIRFRQPTTWQQHKWEISGSLGLCAIEAALIVTLIAQLRRRRRAEQEARVLSGRLIHAQEEERSRLARDLHDDLSQRLALLSVEVELLSRDAPGGDSGRRIARLAESIRDLSSDVHKLAYQLHPAKLDQLGLVAAAQGFCRELSQQTGVPIEFYEDHVPGRLPTDVALCVFRVLQESLHNVVRHSGAKNVAVKLAAQSSQIHLVVEDSGRGFDVERVQHAGGLGLLSMRERVRLLGGTIGIHSEPGHGTRVELTVRLPGENEPA